MVIQHFYVVYWRIRTHEFNLARVVCKRFVLTLYGKKALKIWQNHPSANTTTLQIPTVLLGCFKLAWHKISWQTTGAHWNISNLYGDVSNNLVTLGIDHVLGVLALWRIAKKTTLNKYTPEKSFQTKGSLLVAYMDFIFIF